MALSAMLWPRTASTALPPATDGGAAQGGSAAASAEPAKPAPSSSSAPAPAGEGESKPAGGWSFPPIRWSGSLGYEMRRDIEEGRKSMQRGLIAALNASADTYIWQPWFAQLKGNLGFNASSNGLRRNEGEFVTSLGSRNFSLTGNAQLSLLPLTRFPFEAHVERSDNRVLDHQAVANGYASRRIGFTQHYLRPEGDSMIGWERNTQDSVSSGRDRQDSLQLSLTHTLQDHRFQVNGTRTTNLHERTGERAAQNNLSVQHSYSPDSAVSVQNMANVSRSGYYLTQGENEAFLTQLSSMLFWRPADRPMTVVAGARILALAADNRGIDGISASARVRNVNANVGLNYDFSPYLHLNAGANVNQNGGNSTHSSSTAQTVGLTYQPEPIALAKFQYNWSASTTASNRSGTHESGRQLTLQLTHSLSRTFHLSENSSISTELSQTLSATASKSSAPDAGMLKQMTHSGAISWNSSGDAGMTLVRLSASDTRSFGATSEFFQLINLQASSNLPTGGFSSWTGSLTVQAVRQGGSLAGTANSTPSQPNAVLSPYQDGGFVTTSSGALTFQHQRLFGVRRLRYVSDLRINSQAVLPLLAGPQDQETVAWENRIDYLIGKTQLRASFLVSRLKVPEQGNTTDPGMPAPGRKFARSIMFTFTRNFGD